MTLRVGVLGFVWAVLVGQALGQVPPLRHDLSPPAGSGVEAVAFSPDGKLLAAALNRGELRLWDTRTGKMLAKLDHKSGPGYFVINRGMAFSPDGKKLAVGVWKSTIQTGKTFFWDVEDGKTLTRKTALKENAGVVALAFTPDGKTLVSAHGLKMRFESPSADDRSERPREVRLRDLASGESRLLVPAHDMALSANGRVLATANADEVKIWDMSTMKETVAWKLKSGYVNRRGYLAISPDGKILAVNATPSDRVAGPVTFWDTTTGKPRVDLKPLPNGVPPMSFSPDGKQFLWTDGSLTVRVTDVATGRVLAKYSHPRFTGKYPTFITVAAWSPDGNLIVSGNYNEWGHWFASLHLRDVSGLLPQ